MDLFDTVPARAELAASSLHHLLLTSIVKSPTTQFLAGSWIDEEARASLLQMLNPSVRQGIQPRQPSPASYFPVLVPILGTDGIAREMSLG